MQRTLDMAVSGAVLTALAPVFVLLSLLIKLDSSGPVFYRAQRVGKNGRLFTLYKFRSMVARAARLGPGITTAGDPRVTRLGRWLRRWKLDEWPQLFNVLRGDMSLVGPRPEDPHYVGHYTPDQRRVLAVRPGLTSAASIYYRSEETLLNGSDWEATYVNVILPHKLALELDYLAQRTLWTDLILLCQTIVAVLR